MFGLPAIEFLQHAPQEMIPIGFQLLGDFRRNFCSAEKIIRPLGDLDERMNQRFAGWRQIVQFASLAMRVYGGIDQARPNETLEPIRQDIGGNPFE